MVWVKNYYAVEVQLWVNSEGDLTQKTLVGHHANIPNINLLVVLNTHNYLGGIVKRTAHWGSLSHAMAFVYRPSEVADFSHSLFM